MKRLAVAPVILVVALWFWVGRDESAFRGAFSRRVPSSASTNQRAAERQPPTLASPDSEHPDRTAFVVRVETAEGEPAIGAAVEVALRRSAPPYFVSRDIRRATTNAAGAATVHVPREWSGSAFVRAVSVQGDRASVAQPMRSNEVATLRVPVFTLRGKIVGITGVHASDVRLRATCNAWPEGEFGRREVSVSADLEFELTGVVGASVLQARLAHHVPVRWEGEVFKPQLPIELRLTPAAKQVVVQMQTPEGESLPGGHAVSYASVIDYTDNRGRVVAMGSDSEELRVGCRPISMGKGRWIGLRSAVVLPRSHQSPTTVRLTYSSSFEIRVLDRDRNPVAFALLMMGTESDHITSGFTDRVGRWRPFAESARWIFSGHAEIQLADEVIWSGRVGDEPMVVEAVAPDQWTHVTVRLVDERGTPLFAPNIQATTGPVLTKIDPFLLIFVRKRNFERSMFQIAVKRSWLLWPSEFELSVHEPIGSDRTFPLRQNIVVSVAPGTGSVAVQSLSGVVEYFGLRESNDWVDARRDRRQRFEYHGLPPGTYRWSATTELLGSVEGSVDVVAGATTVIEIK